MPKTARFWSNVALIGLAHVAVITGLIQWGRSSNRAATQSVVWLGGGAGDGVITEKKSPPPAPATKPTPRAEAKTEPLKESESEEDRPILASAPSDIQLPMPKASPKSTASPARTPTSIPTPQVKTTPKQTPKPKPKPTPKPSPKKITLAKASLKPSPKVKPSPPKSNDSDVADAEKKKIEEAAAEKPEPSESEAATKKSAETLAGSGSGTAPGSGGSHAGGAGSDSQFGWYGSMLHDRLYAEWVQPTSVASAVKNSVLVKIRIEKDGRISSFDIVRPSGNAELDQSVAAVAKRVTGVDPIPTGLGNGDHYNVKISFELNSE